MRGQWEERFERRYGFWRVFVDEQVRRYLNCGLFEHGFATVQCPDCHEEYVLAFSCKTRELCPSCAARRAAATAVLLRGEVLEEVGHAQWVFVMPKMVRPYFLHHRELPGGLARHTMRPPISLERIRWSGGGEALYQPKGGHDDRAWRPDDPAAIFDATACLAVVIMSRSRWLIGPLSVLSAFVPAASGSAPSKTADSETFSKVASQRMSTSYYCGNASYDDGTADDTARFYGGGAGDPDKMFAVKFVLADFGHTPGNTQTTGFCAANQMDWGGDGGPFPNEFFIYPDGADGFESGNTTAWSSSVSSPDFRLDRRAPPTTQIRRSMAVAVAASEIRLVVRDRWNRVSGPGG